MEHLREDELRIEAANNGRTPPPPSPPTPKESLMHRRPDWLKIGVWTLAVLLSVVIWALVFWPILSP